MYCQVIGASCGDDDKKLEMLGKVNLELLKWVNTPEPESGLGIARQCKPKD
jgi:hypothetical protein